MVGNQRPPNAQDGEVEPEEAKDDHLKPGFSNYRIACFINRPDDKYVGWHAQHNRNVGGEVEYPRDIIYNASKPPSFPQVPKSSVYM